MGSYRDAAAIKAVRNASFPSFGPQLWATDFVDICHAVPVRLPDGGTKKIAITKYVSGSSGPRTSRAYTLKSQLTKSEAVKEDKDAHNWVKTSWLRIRECFWGHGQIEEIALLLELALKAGLVTPDRLQEWVTSDQKIGLDCNGFTNAYYSALGCFLNKPIYYHNKYRHIAGTAYTWDDINYDSAVLWARQKFNMVDVDKNDDGIVDFRKKVELDTWQVIPNGQSGAHIGVIDHVMNDTIVVCQQGSDIGPRVTEYKIVSEALKKQKAYAVWKLKQGTRDPIRVVLTKSMPVYAAGE